MLAALLLTLASAAPIKVALMPLSAGESTSDKTAQSVTDALAAELRHNPALRLLTSSEMNAVLTVERQKQLVGCQSESCMAEVAGALDVDRLVLGNVAKLGQSWMIHLQLVDARKAQTVGTADRRKKGGTIDDVLDALPEMARELFGAAPAPVATSIAAPPTAAVDSKEPPLPFHVEKLYREFDRNRLKLIEDKAGHAIAFVPFGGISEPMFFGTGNALYAQRVFGGGSEGDKRFDRVFWEPRVRAPAEASFDFRDGVYSITCGKHVVTYTAVPEARAKSRLKEVQLFDVHWDRRAHALARDDEGNYFYVDRVREDEEAKDFRVYLGTEGQMKPVATKVLASDSDADIFGTPAGRLRIGHRTQKAAWLSPAGAAELQLLDLEANHRLVYGKLGVYAHQPLGTPCDGLL